MVILRIILDLHMTQIPLFAITFVVIKFNAARVYTIMYPIVAVVIVWVYRTIVLIINLMR